MARGGWLISHDIPGTLKLTASLPPENGWLEDDSFRFGTLPETNSSPLKMDGWKMICPFETLPETNSSPLNMDGWKMIHFLLDFDLFSGALAVSFRECTP